MKLEELNNLKELLLKEKSEMIKILSLNEELTSTDNSGDDVDKIQGFILNHTQTQLNLRNANKLKSIEDSLKKMLDGSYGVCQDCDESIPYKRLLFNPCVATCVGCAEIREYDRK